MQNLALSNIQRNYLKPPLTKEIHTSTLHISIESAPKHLENNKLLISKTYDEGGFVYVFASHKIEELNLLLAAIEKEVAVTGFQLKR